MARVALQSASPDSSSQLTTEQTEGFCPKAAEVLEEAETDALAYLDFPHEHHVRLRTNNVQERANREPKRRSRVVQVFPNRKSPIGLMGDFLRDGRGLGRTPPVQRRPHR